MVSIQLKPEASKKPFKLASGALLYPGYTYSMTEIPPEVSEKADSFDIKEKPAVEKISSPRQRRKQTGG